MDHTVMPEGLDDLNVAPRSVVRERDTTYFYAECDRPGMVGVIGDEAGFDGVRHEASGALLCQLSAGTVATLRARLAWLRPAPLGLRTSVGFGDRLGLATPGHIRSIRQFPDGEATIAPVLAQQSVRENARTGRTPQQVLDDATVGVFEEGWRRPWGADADHLKTPEDVAAFAAAGYTFFTIDPGDHVDDRTDAIDLEERLQTLPWEALEDSPRDLESRYLRSGADVEGHAVAFDVDLLRRAAVKYGRAVAHTARMYRHINSVMANRPFELEVSVDETSSPTTVTDHIYIATELRRLGVHWVSLAPRFVGRFEKGVDYIGDPGVFATEFALHAAVARQYGPYKLSLHSGSDKFSIYGIASRLTGGSAARTTGPLVHVKTAGTSFLEALRAVSRVDAALFRDILSLAGERYEADRLTYHVSAELARVPATHELEDTELGQLLDQFDARQILHVTFGSVLDRFGDRLRSTLRQSGDVYAEVLQEHFARHLAPFVTKRSAG